MRRREFLGCSSLLVSSPIFPSLRPSQLELGLAGRKATASHDPFSRALAGPRLRPLPTGLADLDALLELPTDGALITIAGRPSMGATALALQAAMTSAEDLNRPILVVCLDTSAVTMAIKAAYSAWISQHLLPSGGGPIRLLEPSSGELLDAPLISHMRKIGFEITDDTPSITVDGIYEMAWAVSAKYGKQPSVIVIDRADRLRSEHRRYGTYTYQAGQDVAGALCRLASDFETRVIMTTRVDGGVELLDDKRPRMRDLTFDSIYLAAASDATLLVYRDEVYDEDSHDKGLGEITVSANLWGCIGTIRARFHRAYGRWSNVTAPKV